MSSDFSHVGKLQSFVRAEGAGGRGSVAMKSVGAKFAEQLRSLLETRTPAERSSPTTEVGRSQSSHGG